MKITRRKLLGSIALAGVSAGAGAGTFAYLSDESTSDITINVGTLDLAEPEEITWSEDPSTQGKDELSEKITIENIGSLPAREVSISGVAFNDPVLAAALKINDIRYGNSDGMESILDDAIPNDENGNTFKDLQDLKVRVVDDNDWVDLDSHAPPATLWAGAKSFLEIDATFMYEEIPEEKNGATLETSFVIEGQQSEA